MSADQNTDDPTHLVVYVFSSTGGGASLTLSPCNTKLLGNQRSINGCGRANKYGGVIHCAKVSTCGTSLIQEAYSRVQNST